VESKTKQVNCAVCNKKFEKSISRIKQTEKLNKQHACSRTCACRLTNDDRMAPPTSANAAHTRKDKGKYPEKTKARQLVRQALKTGKLSQPTCCEYCYDKCVTEAHHPDHYYPFSLVWLCKSCHAKFDKYKWFGYENDYSEQAGFSKNYAPFN
jgi:hypothetical protein